VTVFFMVCTPFNLFILSRRSNQYATSACRV
jgi:hypothetical protein